jgi:thymidylate kinase
MKYIEFLGLPGSGKTTFIKETIAILRAKQHKVFPRPDAEYATMRTIIRHKSGFLWRIIEILAYFSEYPALKLMWERSRYAIVLDFICQHPQLAQQVIQFAKSADPPQWISREVLSDGELLLRFFDLMSVYQAGCDFLNRDDVLLLDEGFCQQAYYLLAFLNGGFNNQVLERYLQLVPKPDLLVVLLTTPEQCEERMQKRLKGVGSAILRRLTASQRLKLLEQRLNIYKKITEYIEKHDVAVIKLHNSDYSTTKKRLEEQLRHF